MNRRIELQEVAAKLSQDANLKNRLDSSSGKSKAERDVIFADLVLQRNRADELRNALRLQHDESWMLIDPQGYQRWRGPFDPKTIDKSYTHRDYFHGRGDKYDRENVPADIEPLRKPHVSLPFRSEATRQFMVAITVPVWDQKQEKVIAVLGRTTHLGNLLEDYGQEIRAQPEDGIERILALVEVHDGLLLDHPWMTQLVRRSTMKD
jgi:hypothetical protein